MDVRQSIEATIITWSRVATGSAFGSPGYYVKGHVFAFWEGEGLVLRLADPARAQALNYAGARRYTVPRGSSAEWVLLSLEGGPPEEELLALLRESYQHSGGELSPRQETE